MERSKGTYLLLPRSPDETRPVPLYPLLDNMTTSTLHAAAKALDSLLAGTPSKSSASKPRRKRTSSKKLLATVDINDLDPAARAQREAEEKKRIDEAVKQLMRGTKLKKDELEVRERV